MVLLQLYITDCVDSHAYIHNPMILVNGMSACIKNMYFYIYIYIFTRVRLIKDMRAVQTGVGWLVGWLVGWMDGWMDGWVGG